jgi:hypothetical protein
MPRLEPMDVNFSHQILLQSRDARRCEWRFCPKNETGKGLRRRVRSFMRTTCGIRGWRFKAYVSSTGFRSSADAMSEEQTFRFNDPKNGLANL